MFRLDKKNTHVTTDANALANVKTKFIQKSLNNNNNNNNKILR